MDILNSFLTWLIKNKEWMFSGAGIFIISLFIARKKQSSQRQKSGSDSKNYMAGRDMRIGNSDD